MTTEQAIHKMEYSKRAYQMLIDEKVQEGVLIGQGINAEWSADTQINDAYKDMLDACEMSIKALKQYEALQEIRTEIADRAQWHYSHNQEDVATIISCEALEIIDKHIKEIEE